MSGHLPLLLRLLDSSGSASDLVKRGLRYSQIFGLIAEAQARGLILTDSETGRIVLTDAGRHASRVSSETGRIGQDGGFILPRTDARVDKLSVESVYLPPRRKSFFGLDRSASPSARERKDGESPS
jgi:hypothetical protein